MVSLLQVSYVGRRKYYDKRIHIHDIVTYHDRDIHIRDIVTSDESDVVTSHRILLTDLTHCTNYTITLSGWNELTNITNKPLYIRTSAKGFHINSYLYIVELYNYFS